MKKLNSGDEVYFIKLVHEGGETFPRLCMATIIDKTRYERYVARYNNEEILFYNEDINKKVFIDEDKALDFFDIVLRNTFHS